MFPNGNVTVFGESCHVYSRTNVQIVQGLQKNSARGGSGEAIALRTFDMFRSRSTIRCFKGRMMLGEQVQAQNQTAPESLVYVKRVYQQILGASAQLQMFAAFTASIIQRLEISRNEKFKDTKTKATIDSGCMSSVKKTSLRRCFGFATKRITTFAIPELKQSEIRLLESSHSAYKAL